MAQIRQEINILDHVISASANGDTDSNEIVLLDTTQYNGTVTYYIEAVGVNGGDGTATFNLLRSGTSTVDASVEIPISMGLARSASFTPPAGQTAYKARLTIATQTSGTTTFKSA